MLYKNYSALSFSAIIPLYILQNIFEIIFFMGMWKPRIAKSYVEGWAFFFKNRKIISSERRKVQALRKVTDADILKLMYPGSAKLLHLRLRIAHILTQRILKNGE
jgi:hypothetical protein